MITKLTTTGTTQTTPNATRHQKISPIKQRMIFYGGALDASDNNAFYYAACNVQADILAKSVTHKGAYSFFLIDSARAIVDIINQQPRGSIETLDILCHSGERALYLYKGASRTKNVHIQEGVRFNASLYLSSEVRDRLSKSISRHTDLRLFSDIKTDRFIRNGAVIELHGCNTGFEYNYFDCICKYLSREIKGSYVIGHDTESTPLINGDGGKTKIKQQDYRHGSRVIWHNDSIIVRTTKKGWLDLKEFGIN